MNEPLIVQVNKKRRCIKQSETKKREKGRKYLQNGKSKKRREGKIERKRGEVWGIITKEKC